MEELGDASAGTNPGMLRMRESFADATRTADPTPAIFGFPATMSRAFGREAEAKASSESVDLLVATQLAEAEEYEAVLGRPSSRRTSPRERPFGYTSMYEPCGTTTISSTVFQLRPGLLRRPLVVGDQEVAGPC